jgi:antirestriction protein ArdC
MQIENTPLYSDYYGRIVRAGDVTIRYNNRIVTKKPYRGINSFLLAGVDAPLFASYKQWQSIGGQVKKGSKGYRVVYWIWRDKEEAKIRNQAPCFPKYSTVFDISQVDGVEMPEREEVTFTESQKIAACEGVLSQYTDKPQIKHDGAKAYYNVTRDYVNMPKPESFHSQEMYYHVLFHELGHSTRHESRLNRGAGESRSFGDSVYAKEELVAEMTASFLSGHCGLTEHSIEHAASYLESWIKAIKGDKKLIVQASGAAQRAADYMLGVKAEELKEAA